jgi:hypothetical protein
MFLSEQNHFECPYCACFQHAGLVKSLKKDEVRGLCSQCKKWVHLKLPPILKKLVYLDQSILKEMCFSANEEGIEKRLFHKLQKLKQLQKIFLVISDIHSSETSAFPDKYPEKMRKLWQFQNSLANGNVAGNFYDVFTAQTRRMLTEHDGADPFHFNDIGLDDPHRWHAGINVLPTNSWRLRLNRADTIHRNEINEKLLNIIDCQVENIPDCREVRDCLNHVLGLWHKDIQQGIDAYQQQLDIQLLMKQYVEALETGHTPRGIQIPQFSDDAPFRRIVGDVIEGLDETIALQLLKKNPICPSMRIRVVFEAELLWTRWQGHRSNPKKINENFGLSRQNDIDHISAFVPYMDVLTTDKDMHNLCEHEIVAEELKQFPVKIYSKKNYDKFEEWLDKLLAAKDL